MSLLILFLAALVAGAVNSVAGGGTLLTFPALLSIGVPPIAANATSTVALVPGSFAAFWGYRDELRASHGAAAGSGREMLWFAVPSLIGGVIGALFVDRVGDRAFARVVPWLIFGATALFALQPVVKRWLERGADAEPGRSRLGWVIAFQLLVAVYGGFFGAGIGILMLAALGFLGVRGIHRMNGVKNFAAVCINGVAAITFVALGRVQPIYAAVMAIGAIVGGLAGAGIARRLGETNVRRLVVVIGVAIGVTMLVRGRA
ncbi:MAG: sulfite exporter TauE/SafE family protein [Deltaproteobacteria bacterium]|nr:sulfite exporter TauE/SafE family protein [Deltaproteobacteria bacterium]